MQGAKCTRNEGLHLVLPEPRLQPHASSHPSTEKTYIHQAAVPTLLRLHVLALYIYPAISCRTSLDFTNCNAANAVVFPAFGHKRRQL